MKKNHFNNYEVWKNHPGYLYYKEFMKYNNKYNKKRTFTGKAFNRKYKLDPIIKPKNKNIYDTYKYNKEIFPKINGKKTIKNGTQVNFSNRNNYNHLYYPFWENKLLNKKDDYIFKALNKDKENHYNKNAKKNLTITYNDKLNHKNIYYNNFMSKKSNNKIKENQDKKGNLIKRGYFINNKNNSNENNEKNNINNIIVNNNNEIENKENDKNKEDKSEKEDNENNDNIDEEKEKLFYTNQKNFFKVRKDIIEEPEYLEEDNDNNEKGEK